MWLQFYLGPLFKCLWIFIHLSVLCLPSTRSPRSTCSHRSLASADTFYFSKLVSTAQLSLTLVKIDYISTSLPPVFSSVPPDSSSDLTEMSPFTPQTADGLFAMFLIIDHTDICDSDSDELSHNSLLIASRIVWNDKVFAIQI